ncbi:MAG TPA: hypothetical protein VL175_21655 [Pirellulales bacterium]|jgi:hypothetical protein|nr:hypothetical protein [Pirellulales bacterium]
MGYKRKQVLIDRQVQGSIIAHLVIYWLTCIVAIQVVSVLWFVVTGPDQPSFLDYLLNATTLASGSRVFLTALVLLPFIVRDALKLSNRFAGPVFRMQRALKQVVADGTFEPIELRENDFWHDFASDLNAAVRRLKDEANVAQARARSAVTGAAMLPPVATNGPTEWPVPNSPLGA